MNVDVSRIVTEMHNWGVRELDPRSIAFTEHHKLGNRTQVCYGTRLRSDGSSVSVVMKIVNPSYANATDDISTAERYKKLIKYFERECRVWCNVGRHSHIAEIYGFVASFQNSCFPAIVMPKYECSLRNLVEDHPDLPLMPRLSLMLGVASGLAHMHSRRPVAIHRDIRASNVLVEIIHGKWNARISDFGSAKLNEAVTGLVNTTVGFSAAWVPPEYIVDGYRTYSEPTTYGDVWSYGCTFLEVLTAKDPWRPTDDIEDKLLRKKHPSRPVSPLIDDEIWEFMRSCWNPVPERRPSAQQIVLSLQ